MEDVRLDLRISNELRQSESSPGSSSGGDKQYAARLVATGGLYFVAGMSGLLVPFTTSNVSPIWPASGVALASLFVFGWRCWPAVTVAAFLVNYISLLSPFAALGLALGNTAASLSGYFLLRRIPGFQPSLSRLQDLLGLIAFAAVISSTISASFGCIVFSVSGIKPWGSLAASWLMYYMGDAMGILLAAPALLSLEDFARRHRFRRIAELGCLLFLLATTCVLLFDERINVGAHHTALTLLVFPFVLWAAIRFGILGTALANGVIASLAVVETAHGFGPFSKGLPLTNALLLQLFLATVAISGLLLAAVIAEQKSIEAARRTVVREKAAQEAKQESEKRYRLIVELASEGIWTLDGEYRTTLVNHQFAQMLGYGPDEMLGKSPEAFCLDTLPRLERALYVNEFRLQKKDGAVLWAGLSATRISDEQKGTHEILVMVTDINERKRAEEQIRESSSELQNSRANISALIESVTDLIWSVDRKHRLLTFNSAVNEHFRRNYGTEARLGLIFEDLLPPERVVEWTPLYERAMAEGPFLEEYIAIDGRIFEMALHPILRDGEAVGVSVFGKDITERKRAEEQILKSRTELQGILDNSPALIYMKDLAGRYLFVNRSWMELFDTTGELVQGKTDFELFPEEAARQFVANDQRVMESLQALDFEEEATFEDGVRYYHSVKVALRNSEGRIYALCGISTDISERKRADEALRQRNRALRVLSNCNSAVVHATEEQALLNEVCRVAVGPAGYKLAWVGYADHDEARTVRPVASAGPAEGFLDRVHVSWADNQYGRGAIGPAIREGRAVVVRHVLNHPAFSIWRELFEIRKFGALLALPLRHLDSVFGALTVYAEEPGAFDSTEVDLLTELSDNLAHGILSLRARAERTEALAALERSRLELEERVRERTAELVEAKEAAESADRLKSTFLATMSHELRTPLNSIIGFTGIVSQGMAGPLNPEQTKQLTIVKNSARHLLDLINDVLDISKIEAGQLEVQCEEFSLPRAIEKVAAIVSPLANKKGISLHTEVSPEVGSIISDQRRTEQILLNLMGNAVKFTDEGSVIVRCWRENKWLVTAITDTGIGIDQQQQESIFEPFRQADTGLARKREGTGLGLSICRRLVEHLGGIISVESVPGQGSTFTIQLPMERDKSCE
jgi:PAS domain S-box-containing protein